ncbi:urea carboxylase-associated family protein [Conexibacter sp. CPCC 206217]|uniref:urea carboxylase-associated family protein n=1 Tax=Conexibacter sp. CPCC 206217 TaxID=3064574 RepID=UPI0027211FE5|nr:urea carboxylase-associated family protein [Conexibacter sp. CPCC 206217]MDO8210190.1 urea carboxylase-associated family protein [Conexibacter sp. CPCC 206217]
MSGTSAKQEEPMHPPVAAANALLGRSPQLVPTPIDLRFYERAIAALDGAPTRWQTTLDDLSGAAIEVAAGETISIELLEGPQIVNMFAFNRADPDERIWHQTVLREGLWMRRLTRIYGTMARSRPLLTVLRDTVVTDPRGPFGQHHIYFGGSGTPAEWRFAGGPDGVRTTWEQFAGALEDRGLDPSILIEHVCLFQKSTIERNAQRVQILPSDARAGDVVTLFAEIDLVVLLALSPYVDGTRPASAPGLPQPRPVAIRVGGRIAEPLGWPHPDISYPDLSRYLDERGVRTREVVPTPGIDYRLNPTEKEHA